MPVVVPAAGVAGQLDRVWQLGGAGHAYGDARKAARVRALVQAEPVDAAQLVHLDLGPIDGVLAVGLLAKADDQRSVVQVGHPFQVRRVDGAVAAGDQRVVVLQLEVESGKAAVADLARISSHVSAVSAGADLEGVLLENRVL